MMERVGRRAQATEAFYRGKGQERQIDVLMGRIRIEVAPGKGSTVFFEAEQ